MFSPKSKADMKVFNTIFSQFLQNIEKQPGWVPLLVLVYLLFSLVPTEVSIFGLSFEKHLELIVSIITFVFYHLGDAVDKGIFKRYVEPFWNRYHEDLVKSPKSKIRAKLGIHDGIYKVAKSIAIAANEYEGKKIQLYNELAKFARGAALLLCFAPLIPFTIPILKWLFPIVGIILFAVYLRLKPLHMGMLYRKTTELISTNEKKEKQQDTHQGFNLYDLPVGIRLFFWKGQLVASAKLPEAGANENGG